MKARFYNDPVTGCPHISNHQVEEYEVIQVLESPGEDRAGREGSRIAVSQTFAGRLLRVVYVPDEELKSVFVITAYELSEKAVIAYRRRKKRKQQ